MPIKKVISAYSVIPNEVTHTHSNKLRVSYGTQPVAKSSFSCPQHGGLLGEQNYSSILTSLQC